MIDATIPVVINIITFVILYLPFVIVGLMVGMYFYKHHDWNWPLAVGVGVAAFALMLGIVKGIGLLASLIRPPARHALKLIEFIAVTGLQIVIAFNLSMDHFMPEDIRQELSRADDHVVEIFVEEAALVDRIRNLGDAEGHRLSYVNGIIRSDRRGEFLQPLAISTLISGVVGCLVWGAYSKRR